MIHSTIVYGWKRWKMNEQHFNGFDNEIFSPIRWLNTASNGRARKTRLIHILVKCFSRQKSSIRFEDNSSWNKSQAQSSPLKLTYVCSTFSRFFQLNIINERKRATSDDHRRPTSNLWEKVKRWQQIYFVFGDLIAKSKWYFMEFIFVGRKSTIISIFIFTFNLLHQFILIRFYFFCVIFSWTSKFLLYFSLYRNSIYGLSCFSDMKNFVFLLHRNWKIPNRIFIIISSRALFPLLLTHSHSRSWMSSSACKLFLFVRLFKTHLWQHFKWKCCKFLLAIVSEENRIKKICFESREALKRCNRKKKHL